MKVRKLFLILIKDLLPENCFIIDNEFIEKKSNDKAMGYSSDSINESNYAHFINEIYKDDA